jgi:hypothetical protein
MADIPELRVRLMYPPVIYAHYFHAIKLQLFTKRTPPVDRVVKKLAGAWRWENQKKIALQLLHTNISPFSGPPALANILSLYRLNE